MAHLDTAGPGKKVPSKILFKYPLKNAPKKPDIKIIKEFLIFKKILEKSNFSYQQVENFYFFPSKRWDLKLKNNILLKLPNDQTLEALNYAYKFLDDFKKEKFTVVDVRIENQIILNE